MKTQLFLALLVSSMSLPGSIHEQIVAKLLSPNIFSQVDAPNVSLPDAIHSRTKIKSASFLEKLYPNIKSPEWRYHKDGSYAFYVQNRQYVTISFDKKGNWVQTLRKYYPDELPDGIKHKVEEMYPEYEIYFVNELTSPKINNPVYILQMKANKMYINLLATNDEMIEHKIFREAK